MKIKFKLLDYDANKLTSYKNKSKFLKDLNNLIDFKEKELKENRFCIVSCDSDISGKVVVRIITKREEENERI